MKKTKYQVGDLLESVLTGELYLIEDLKEKKTPYPTKQYNIRILAADFTHDVGSSIIENESLYRKIS